MDWNLIDTLPAFEFVLAYCKEAHETRGAASQSKGCIIICYRPATENSPEEFIDQLGIKLNWRFTHWKPLPDPPL